MSLLSVILQSLLVAYFLFSGVAKIVGAKYWVDMFVGLNLPQWFRVFTGSFQLVGAFGLIIGYWIPGAIAWASIWLGMTMLVAFILHLKIKDPMIKTLPPVFFAVLIITLIILNVDHIFLLSESSF